MQMRTKLAIVTVIGAGALLIAVLAVFIASRPQIAYAQNSQPTVQIGLNNVFGNATRGQPLAQYTFKNFQSIACDVNDGNQHSTTFDDPCYHRTEIYHRGTNNRAGECEQGLSGNRSFSKGDGIERVIDSFHIILPRSCPEGQQYRLEVFLMGSNRVAVTSATAYFGVGVAAAPAPILTATPTRTPTATPRPTRRPQPPPPPPPTATPTATATLTATTRRQRRQQRLQMAATIRVAATRAVATRYSPTRPRRQPRHRQQRVSCSSGNSKYQRCPQPRLQPRRQPRLQPRLQPRPQPTPQQRQHKAAATKVAATTRATTKAATTVAKTKATTRVAASSHLSATRHHHRHRRHSSHRRRSRSPCRSY